MTRRRAGRLLLLLALVLAGAGTTVLASAGTTAPGTAPAAGTRGDAAAGRLAFVDRCATCHGLDARGRAGRGPSLIGAGALAADFYLRTGRMPLAHPTDEPVRTPVVLSGSQIDDLVAYVGSLGGPAVPVVRPQLGSLARGRRLFSDSCAGCHQVAAQGGIFPGGVAPSLQQVSARQIAEALRIGPYLMPRFGTAQLDQADVNALARYVLFTRDLPDAGGWGIGHIGPIPEGMVAWFMALAAVLGAARLLGERTP